MDDIDEIDDLADRKSRIVLGQEDSLNELIPGKGLLSWLSKMYEIFYALCLSLKVR